MHHPEENAALRIGSWAVYPADGFIEQAGERRPLRLKSMEVLLLLSTRPGSTIPREEFLKSIWKDELVEEANLTRCIAEIRAALGDDARSPRYVVTVPRRGYRLVARVRSLRADRQGRLRYRKWAAALLVATALAAAAIYSSRLAGTEPAARNLEISGRSLHARVRVALLPITQLGEDPTYDWALDVVSRMLAAELAAGSESSTVPVGTVLDRAGRLAIPASELRRPAALRHLASAIGATHWLSGSFLPVRQDGRTELRFDLLLLDARTGLALHGAVLTARPDDLAQEVSRVARELRRALRVPQGPGGPSRGGDGLGGRHVAFLRAG